MLKNILIFVFSISLLGISARAGFDMLPSKTGECHFFYPTDKNTQGWYIEPASDNMCQDSYINKHGQVTIYNAFGQPIEQIYGFFNGGYWTGDRELSAQVITGYAENSDTYKVSFELANETEFDIRYLSQMVSQKQKDKNFGPFSFCQPFRVLVQTQDYGLFQDKSLMTKIIDDVAHYAKTLCPTEHKIQLFGSPKERPTQSDVFFYADIDLKTAQIDVKKNDAIAFAQHEQNETEALTDTLTTWKQSEAITPDMYHTLTDTTSDNINTIAQTSQLVEPTITDGNKIQDAILTDSIPHLLTISRLTEKPVQGTVIVEIKQVLNNTAQVVHPFSLYLTGKNLTEGWAIISGSFSYKSGRKGAELTGTAEITSVIPCQQAYCKDIK